MDADDPFFTPARSSCCSRPALRAYVVTAEHAARRYEALGVDKPWVVIPQGVNLKAATDELRAEAAARKQPGEVVLGWMAAHLLTEGDRGADNPLYNVDHLLELWDADPPARAARAPLARRASRAHASSTRLAGRADIVLFGRLPRERALAVASQLRRRALCTHARPGRPEPRRCRSSSVSACRLSPTTTR